MKRARNDVIAGPFEYLEAGQLMLEILQAAGPEFETQASSPSVLLVQPQCLATGALIKGFFSFVVSF